MLSSWNIVFVNCFEIFFPTIVFLWLHISFGLVRLWKPIANMKYSVYAWPWKAWFHYGQILPGITYLIWIHRYRFDRKFVLLWTCCVARQAPSTFFILCSIQFIHLHIDIENKWGSNRAVGAFFLTLNLLENSSDLTPPLEELLLPSQLVVIH